MWRVLHTFKQQLVRQYWHHRWWFGLYTGCTLNLVRILCSLNKECIDWNWMLEKTTRSSPHHVAQHRPTGSETTPPYAPRSSRFGSEPSSVEDDIDLWRYAILSCVPETTTMTYHAHANRPETTLGLCLNKEYIDWNCMLMQTGLII